MDTSNQTESTSNRNYERSALVYYLRVFDAYTNVLLGHVVDISTGGIKLVSHDPLKLNRTYTLKVILPKEIMGKSELLFDTEICWSEGDTNPDFTITGFSFRSLIEDHRTLIQMLFDEFGRDTTLSPVTSERPACNLSHSTGR